MKERNRAAQVTAEYMMDPDPQPRVPVVVARQDHGDWIVVMRLDDFLTVAGAQLRAG